MKNLITRFCYLFLFFHFSEQIIAQRLSYGISAGVHISNINIQPLDLAYDPFIFNSKPQNGYHIGVYRRIGLGLIYFEPQCWFTYLNQPLNISNRLDVDSTFQVPLDLSHLDFPVEFGLKIGPLIALYAPVFSIPVFDISQPSNWSNQFGIGLKLFRFQFNLRYQSPFDIRFSDISLDNLETNYRAQASKIIVSIFMKI